MKRFPLKVVVLALSIAVSTVIFSPKAFAQKGEKTLGVMAGYSGYNDGAFTSIYFQYTFAKHVRISPELGYVFKNKEKSAFEVGVDINFPFRLSKGIEIYPLTGLTINDWRYQGNGHLTRFGADFGGGLDFYLTSYLKLNVQGKYSLMKDTDGVFVGLGIGYVF
ncbi:MAG: porin family protein [Prevotella sp.]|nr:porin family protein [Bacteroides sp.]MCM1366515.1 porin family protein [Prevotella sp.]